MRSTTLIFLSVFALAAGGVVFALSLPSISLRPVVLGVVDSNGAVTTPKDSVTGDVIERAVDIRPTMVHIAAPEPMKSIYMSQCYASSKNLREKLLKIADETEVNSIIVDIKDYTGTIAFTPTNPTLVVGGEGCKVRDMPELIAEMHKRGIYVIGRITVFQDPFMVDHHPEWAVKRVSNPDRNWADRKGLGFIDVGAKAYWDYIIALSRDSHEIGFDELNYDYIRFPSDGNMKDALYTLSEDRNWKTRQSSSEKVGTKAEHVERFFIYLTTEMRKEYASRNKHVQKNAAGETVPHLPVLSADIFGMTATNEDDLTIGQVLERAVPHFDYVAPMVYPSHYPPGFNGYKDPNKNVYGVIKYSMDKAVARVKASETTVEGLTHVPAKEIVEKEVKNEPARPGKGEVTKVKEEVLKVRNGKQVYTKQVYPATKLRTWIQDFDYGGDYGPTEVRAQFQATYDAGLTSWMIWSPSNRYTVEALKAK